MRHNNNTKGDDQVVKVRSAVEAGGAGLEVFGG